MANASAAAPSSPADRPSGDAASRIRLAANDGSALFAGDATFCARPGVGGVGVTFESINFPGAYLRHFDSQAWIAAGGGTGFDRPLTISADSSWNVVAPWAP